MLSVGNIVGGTFDFVRRKIGVIATWSLLYLVAAALLSLLVQPMFADMATGATSFSPAAAAVMALIYPLFLLLFIVLFAAAFRAVLKPADSRFAYLRVGMDELRLLGLIALLIVASIGASLLLMIVAMIASLIFALILGLAGTIVAALLIYLGMIGAGCYFLTRLSLVAPLTMLRGRITIAEAWKLTKGRFWTLFGAYIVILLILAVPFFILTSFMMTSAFTSASIAAGDPNVFVKIMRAQMAMQAPGRPMWFVNLILGGVFGGVGVALQGGMTAIATRLLIHDDEALSETFA